MEDNESKIIFITGSNGQDGSLMIDYLLKNTCHNIYAGIRNENTANLNHISSDRFHTIDFNLNDSKNIYDTIEKVIPDYFINFAAQSNVSSSWATSKLTFEVNTLPIIDILEAIIKYCPKCRFYNAGSSEEFGNIIYHPQDEFHPLKPHSPYAASKISSRQIINVYRETYNIYAIQGWLFNHEGTRRGDNFVTRKITKYVANIFNRIEKNISITSLELGNIYASRDWSDAEDFVSGIWLMLNQDKYDKLYNGTPKEYILSSGKSHTIKEFVEIAFKVIDIVGFWENESSEIINEKYYYLNKEKEKILLVNINPQYYRKCDLNITCGNSSKIKYELGWEPKITFEELVKKMVNYDIELLQNYE
jgi:GDPmannose 4,6-dehydratase